LDPDLHKKSGIKGGKYSSRASPSMSSSSPAAHTSNGVFGLFCLGSFLLSVNNAALCGAFACAMAGQGAQAWLSI